jgi:hypothetical protein
MTPQRLADMVLSTSQTAHPNYSKEQHLAWSIGLLATTVLYKNSNDNVIWARLEQQLEAITSNAGSEHAIDLSALDQLARASKPKQAR